MAYTGNYVQGQSPTPPSLTNVLMIVAGIIFFLGLFVIVGLRICAMQSRSQEAELVGELSSIENHRRSTNIRVFSLPVWFSDPAFRQQPSGQEEKLGFGLEASVFENLPTFIFKQGSEKLRSKEDVECCVCLQEFAEGEKGRILPNCGHCFHADCVDMWFFSHTTCPMCRSQVEILEPLPSPAAGPPQSTTKGNDGTHIRFQPSGPSAEMGASQSFTSGKGAGKASSSELDLDLELGRRNRRGFPTREPAAGRQSQQDGRSAVSRSSKGPSSSEESISDGRDAHQPV